MLRFTTILMLLIALLFVVRGVTSNWSSGQLPLSEDGKPAQTAQTPKNKPIELYPAVPVVLPDLNTGYIFNEKRLLEEKAANGSGPAGAGFTADSIELDEVLYTGSIIVGSIRKALISYPDTKPQKSRGSRRLLPGKKTTRTGKYKHKRLSLGQIFNGYKVIEVSPARIVFERSGDKIARFLYDQKKDRVIASAPSKKNDQARQSKKTARKTAADARRPSSVAAAPKDRRRSKADDNKKNRRPLSRSQRAMQRLMKESPLLEIPGRIPPGK